MTNTTTKDKLLIVDTSYYIFYKINAIKTWMGHAHPDIDIESFTSVTECDVYMTSYNKSFFNQLEKIMKSGKFSQSDVIFARDCSRDDIFRNLIYDEYKTNRDYTKFNAKELFAHTYDNLLPKYPNAKVLRFPRLEADDIAAIITMNYSDKYDITIITNDNDYLQLLQYPIKLINLKGDDLSKRCKVDWRFSLMSKIILGDKSDNIPKIFPRCGECTLKKYHANKSLLDADLNSNPNYKEQYRINKLLVDFNYIPNIYVQNVLETLCIILK
jgi:5'-3' exonuclease